MTIEIIEQIQPGTEIVEEIVVLELSVIEGDTAASQAAATAAAASAIESAISAEIATEKAEETLQISLSTFKTFNYNNLSIPYDSPPIVESGILGDFDEGIRELGNVVFDESTDQYLLTYSGYPLPYNSGIVYIGLATSADGKTWTKQGQIISTPSEDPFLVIHNGTYYLYVEEKTIKKDIELFTSTDLINWESQGLVLITGSGWDASNVASPLVYINNNVWYLFYEGLGVGNAGAIGLATSSDGINFTKIPDPIFSGTQLNGNIQWATHVVCDDIIKLGEFYYMSIHAFNGKTFVCGVLISSNLTTWYDYINSWITTSFDNDNNAGQGIMFFQKDNTFSGVHVFDENIYLGNFSIRSDDGWEYTERDRGDSVFKVISGGKNEILKATITSSKTWILGNDLSSKRGVNKFIQNPTSFTLTIQPESGVTINGLTDNYLVNSGESVWLVSTSSNNWMSLQQFSINPILDSDLLHKTGNETKTGQLLIDNPENNDQTISIKAGNGNAKLRITGDGFTGFTLQRPSGVKRFSFELNAYNGTTETFNVVDSTNGKLLLRFNTNFISSEVVHIVPNAVLDTHAVNHGFLKSTARTYTAKQTFNGGIRASAISGSFTTTDGKTVTVTEGVITSII